MQLPRRHAAYSRTSPPSAAFTRGQPLFSQQRRDCLLSVLQALPERDRDCLYLRAEGLQYREIAEVLDISLGGVSKSLARAIRRLGNADHW